MHSGGTDKRPPLPGRPWSNRQPEKNLRHHLLWDIDGLFLLAQSPAKFRQGNILQLPDTLPRDSELLTHLLQGLWFATIQAESLKNDLSFAIVQYFEELTHLVTQIFVPEQLEGCLGVFIPN